MLTSVLLNRVPDPWIACQHGLRQRDPLSPYLFIIVVNLLYTMLVDGDGDPPLLHPLTDTLFTFLSLTTRLAQMATTTEMLVGACKRGRRVHTSSNGARERLG
jgi:hypothetical protein